MYRTKRASQDFALRNSNYCGTIAELLAATFNQDLNLLERSSPVTLLPGAPSPLGHPRVRISAAVGFFWQRSLHRIMPWAPQDPNSRWRMDPLSNRSPLVSGASSPSSLRTCYQLGLANSPMLFMFLLTRSPPRPIAAGSDADPLHPPPPLKSVALHRLFTGTHLQKHDRPLKNPVVLIATYKKISKKLARTLRIC